MAHAEGQHGAAAGQHAPAAAGEHQVEGQQHPLGIYFKIWGLLFVLSTLSYLVDYFHFQGYLRWTLIIVFMLAVLLVFGRWVLRGGPPKHWPRGSGFRKIN